MDDHVVEGVSGRQEVLVILSSERATEVFKFISANYHVQQSASPRVAVVECPQSKLADLKAIPGVTVVTTGNPPPEVMNSLNDGESLFVAAWVSRTQTGSSKQRSGEGLSWDTPGLVPPDPPTNPSKPDKNNS